MSIALSRSCCLPYEDKRFASISALIRFALARAAQLITQRPHRVGRLDHHHAGGAAARAAWERIARGKAASDGAGDGNGAASHQGSKSLNFI